MPWIPKLKNLFGYTQVAGIPPSLKIKSAPAAFLLACRLRPAIQPCGAWTPAAYLENQGNRPETIARFKAILKMNTIILELGCGNAEISWQIAMKNPDIGVIATDLYRSPCLAGSVSGYTRASRSWTNSLFKAQVLTPDNLVVMRADADILRFLPAQSIDTILLVNPEPAVGRAFLKFLAGNSISNAVRPGGKQLVIKPFSKKMGIATCGGYEFETEADWSRGIGFMLESPFTFTVDVGTQWAVDLGAFSDYSRNSTQNGVSVCGNIGRLPQIVETVLSMGSQGTGQLTSPAVFNRSTGEICAPLAGGCLPPQPFIAHLNTAPASIKNAARERPLGAGPPAGHIAGFTKVSLRRACLRKFPVDKNGPQANAGTKGRGNQ